MSLLLSFLVLDSAPMIYLSHSFRDLERAFGKHILAALRTVKGRSRPSLVILSGTYKSMKPARPNLLAFASVRELYLHFERIFLSGAVTAHQITSSCGHTIMVFDHHFFHLVKLDDPTKPKPLKMASEKAIILATASGFGPYVHDKQRAIYLESAMACLISPDEVWEDHSLTSAKWIYLKEFDAKPYSWTIALVSERVDGPVPNTSFPAKERDARKWRRGTQIFP